MRHLSIYGLIPLSVLVACAQIPTVSRPALSPAEVPFGFADLSGEPRPTLPAAPAPAPAPLALEADHSSRDLPMLATEHFRRDLPTLAGSSSPAVPRLASDGVDLSYTFAEAGANFLDVDNLGGTSEDVDSWFLNGSLSLGLIHLIGGIENQTTDFQNTDASLIHLGAGVHLSLLSRLAGHAEVAWLFNDVSSDLASLDGTNNGYRVRAGARFLLLPWDRGGLELNGNLIWTDLDDVLASDEEAAGFELGARFHLLGYFSVGGAYTFFEDDDMVGVSARVSF